MDNQAKQESNPQDFGVKALDFILAHIHKTGDNPDSEKAQRLRDELRELALIKDS